MIVLRFTSCQSEIAESFCKALAQFIGAKLGIPWEFVGDIPWQERERLLVRGEIQVAWICGLPYVRENNGEKILELLAAPVMTHPRYDAKAVYYSDVIVHAESLFQSFEDLRGRTWAYNEPGSHSGYNLPRYHLATKGLMSSYFGRVVESGSHQNSLRMILDRTVDASAIDSTVLEMTFAANPSIIPQVRTISTLGPSPAPPWVVHNVVPGHLRETLRREFLSMHHDPRGRHILEGAGMLRFAAVSDEEYEPIREMEQAGAVVSQWRG
jgi:phosphonate transport system substrate-binding protein